MDISVHQCGANSTFAARLEVCNSCVFGNNLYYCFTILSLYVCIFLGNNEYNLFLEFYRSPVVEKKEYNRETFS